jgi:hypothetical protein
MGLNVGFLSEKLMSNCLSYGIANEVEILNSVGIGNASVHDEIRTMKKQKFDVWKWKSKCPACNELTKLDFSDIPCVNSNVNKESQALNII